MAYDWPEKSSRHRLLSDFVDAFFSRFSEFQAASRLPKWQEINLAASLPGWRRFKPAERWLQSSQARQRGSTATGSVPRPDSTGRDAENERLFREFLLWREQQRGR
ncbi:hypothetical protein [Microvirga massiliensis]|uniref:hypothetical protein n=1 Tax=Microvirga massiliensis TaxID=1033741 RepID=UPI001FCD1ABE|nr:hypothetical protein [Microvirga massiliensis]